MHLVSGWKRVTFTGPSHSTVTRALGLNLKVLLGGSPPAVRPATQCEPNTLFLHILSSVSADSLVGSQISMFPNHFTKSGQCMKKEPSSSSS